MTEAFRNSRFLDFNTGDVLVPPMRLAQQKERPWDLPDKIDIFECRVEVWQLGVAVQILREMESPKRLPIWRHAAYGLISVIFSYFEMIGKTLNPKSTKWKSGKIDFKFGFCDVYPQYRDSTGKFSREVGQFQDRIRNGMYHLAYTKKGLLIHHDNALSLRDFDTKLPSELPEELGVSGQVFLMDPHRVTRTLVKHFGDFMLRLRQPGSKGDEMRVKFEEFFDKFQAPEAES
jgi:hypothetical protein